MQITFKVDKLETGEFMAYCPSMKPVIVVGSTEEEATTKLLATAKQYLKQHPEIHNSLRSSDLGN